MTIRIYKYQADPPSFIINGKAAEFILEIPGDARILTVAWPYDKITFWAEVKDSDMTILEKRTMFIIPTGGDKPDFRSNNYFLRYINTIFKGPHVWHIYEKYFFSGSVLC